MHFLEKFGFKLYGIGLGDIWILKDKEEVIFKASFTLSGKIMITNNDVIIFSSREEKEISEFLTRELRNYYIDKLL